MAVVSRTGGRKHHVGEAGATFVLQGGDRLVRKGHSFGGRNLKVKMLNRRSPSRYHGTTVLTFFVKRWQMLRNGSVEDVRLTFLPCQLVP